MGWRTSATRNPWSSSSRPTAREVWLFPQPVRTAVTATTGRGLVSIVAPGPSRRKSAPVASTRDAWCITSVWGRSE